MSTGAVLTVVITNERQADAVAGAAIAAVPINKRLQTIGSIDEDLETIGFVIPPTSDLTTVPTPGSIQREVTADFSANFMAMYPTDPQRLAVLHGVLGKTLRNKGPCVITSETEVLF